MAVIAHGFGHMTLPWFQSDQFPLYLAPMAGYTDVVFRGICKSHGADVMVSEFVLADNLLGDRPRVWETVDFTEEQRPMGVQIFGADPMVMGEAARRIEDRLHPDFIDLNYGCPSPRICNLQAGSSLLKDLPSLEKIASTVVRAIPNTPVTAKIRLGWDAENVVAPEAARRLEGAGIQAIAVHGRTKVQGYQGAADWERIHEVTQAVQIPVIGNGSIADDGDLISLARQSGVRGLMIGRAALGYPWIFRELRAAHEGIRLPPPAPAERWNTLLHYAEEAVRRPHLGPAGDRIHWMRPRLKFFTRHLRGGRRLRLALEQVNTMEELRILAAQNLEEFGEISQPQTGSITHVT